MPLRCPHCQAEVPAGAAFCAACGGNLPGGAHHEGVDGETPSLFELPQSGRARVLRIATVLTLDVVLAGAGIGMIASYFNARAEAAQPIASTVAAPAAEPPAHEAQVEVTAPRVVRPPEHPGDPRTQVPLATPPKSGGGAGTPTPSTPATGPQPSEGDILGGISRRPDGGAPTTTPPPTPTTTPPPVTPIADASVPASTPPTDPPDAAVAATDPPGAPDPTDAEQALATGVQRSVEGHMAQVRRCWENVAKSSSDSNLPEGTIEIEFAVLPSGSPSGVSVVQNGTGSDQLATCVVALVNSWSFPAHDGEPVVFVWPFLFKASK